MPGIHRSILYQPLRQIQREMKATKLVFTGLLFAILVFVSVIADAHWGFDGGAILGVGLSLFTGFAFVPSPVYVAPPVHYKSCLSVGLRRYQM